MTLWLKVMTGMVTSVVTIRWAPPATIASRVGALSNDERAQRAVKAWSKHIRACCPMNCLESGTELPSTISQPNLFSKTRPGSTLATSIAKAIYPSQVEGRFVEQSSGRGGLT